MTKSEYTCIYTFMKARTPLPQLEALRSQRHVCFAEQLRSANRAIGKLYAKHLESNDINIAQLSVLIRLYYFESLKVSRLATILETDRTTVTRNVQLLERSGHVEVIAGEDGRERLVRITAKGFASLKRALPAWEDAQAELMDRLGPDQWSALFSGLRVLAQLDQDSGRKARTPGRRMARKAAA